MISEYFLRTLYQSKELFNILIITDMTTLPNNFTAPVLEPKSKADNLYVIGMIATVILLFVFAYYDQIASNLLG